MPQKGQSMLCRYENSIIEAAIEIIISAWCLFAVEYVKNSFEIVKSGICHFKVEIKLIPTEKYLHICLVFIKSL